MSSEQKFQRTAVVNCSRELQIAVADTNIRSMNVKVVRYDSVVPGSLMWILKWLLDRLPNNLLVLTQRNGDSNRHGETKQSFHGVWSQSLCLSCSQAVVRNDNPNDLCGRLNDEATTFRG